MIIKHLFILPIFIFSYISYASDLTSPFLESLKITQWMDHFFINFDKNEIKTRSIEMIFENDTLNLENEPQQVLDMVDHFKVHGGYPLPEQWTIHSKSVRACNIEHINVPDYLYKLALGAPGRGNYAAHYLRVGKGKEIANILVKEELDKLEVVEESLIALNDKNSILEEQEGEAKFCFFFIVKSKKRDLFSEIESKIYIEHLEKFEQAELASQLAKMIICTGLGDVGFHNFHIDKTKNTLVIVDTEPLYGSMVLDIDNLHPKPTGNPEQDFLADIFFQIRFQRSLKTKDSCRMSECIKRGLNMLLISLEHNEVMHKVIIEYIKSFNEHLLDT